MLGDSLEETESKDDILCIFMFEFSFSMNLLPWLLGNKTSPAPDPLECSKNMRLDESELMGLLAALFDPVWLFNNTQHVLL